MTNVLLTFPLLITINNHNYEQEKHDLISWSFLMCILLVCINRDTLTLITTLLT